MYPTYGDRREPVPYGLGWYELNGIVYDEHGSPRQKTKNGWEFHPYAPYDPYAYRVREEREQREYLAAQERKLKESMINTYGNGNYITTTPQWQSYSGGSSSIQSGQYDQVYNYQTQQWEYVDRTSPARYQWPYYDDGTHPKSPKRLQAERLAAEEKKRQEAQAAKDNADPIKWLRQQVEATCAMGRMVA